ncbi:MAG: DUF177 domain-containing protein [Prolixibacteraceae bacterium]|nr:DUF177 domain-containing protein [Prolixibacteraceae bacterium]
MSWVSKYNIEFIGLNEGLHDFEFEIDDSFFEHFEKSLVTKGKVSVGIALEKRSAFLKLHFKIKGWVELTCDRCLEQYHQKIKYKTDIFVKFGEKEFEESENIIYVLPGEHHLNLTQLIYEFTMLCIPMRHIHPKDENGKRGCNSEMLEKLKIYKFAENKEKVEPDPRWEVLKNLKNNN